MDYFYDRTYLIGTGDVDLHSRCKPSALMMLMQETAVAHAEQIHLGRNELMEQYGVFWMIARAWYRLERPLMTGETVTVRTWHRGGAGAMMYRDFDLLADGVRVGEAVTVWVLADVKSHRLYKLSKVPAAAELTGGTLCKDIKVGKLRMPEQMETVEQRRMHYSDTDLNGHVNNTRYADFACDALRLEELPEERFVSAMQIGYVTECLPGELLELHTARQEEQDFVHGTDRKGTTRFDAAVWYGTQRHPA